MCYGVVNLLERGYIVLYLTDTKEFQRDNGIDPKRLLHFGVKIWNTYLWGDPQNTYWKIYILKNYSWVFLNKYTKINVSYNFAVHEFFEISWYVGWSPILQCCHLSVFFHFSYRRGNDLVTWIDFHIYISHSSISYKARAGTITVPAIFNFRKLLWLLSHYIYI